MLQAEEMEKQGYPRFSQEPQMPDLLLQDLVFSLLGFGLSLVPSFLPMPPSFLGEYLLHTIMYWKYIIYFLESQKRLGLLNRVGTARDYEDF